MNADKVVEHGRVIAQAEFRRMARRTDGYWRRTRPGQGACSKRRHTREGLKSVAPPFYFGGGRVNVYGYALAKTQLAC